METAGKSSGKEDPSLWEQIHQRIKELEDKQELEYSGDELKDLWYRRALELSVVPEHELRVDHKEKHVIFKLDSDRYGVPINLVHEIQRIGDITPIDTAPEFVVGVINLRGNILSIVDMRIFFGLEGVTQGEKSRVLVAQEGGMRIGILVDQVDEIGEVSPDEVKPPLSTARGIAEEYIRGIVAHKRSMLILVDLAKILKNPRLVVDEVV